MNGPKASPPMIPRVLPLSLWTREQLTEEIRSTQYVIASLVRQLGGTAKVTVDDMLNEKWEFVVKRDILQGDMTIQVVNPGGEEEPGDDSPGPQ